MRLTICFDAPYWIGLVELESDGMLYAARHIFGAEPSDAEVYAFVQSDFLALLQRMTVGLPVETTAERTINPKRMQRLVRREILQTKQSCKAHEAMRIQIEANKRERHILSRADRDAKRQHKRAVAVLKAKAKHKGH